MDGYGRHCVVCTLVLANRKQEPIGTYVRRVSSFSRKASTSDAFGILRVEAIFVTSRMLYSSCPLVCQKSFSRQRRMEWVGTNLPAELVLEMERWLEQLLVMI